MEILNTSFKHPKWFVQLNKETQKYEPYTTKKEALQYFASCGDFYNDNGVLRYSGKEKGSYKMNSEEIKYFADLLNQKAEAKEEAQKYVEGLKLLLSEENNKAEKNFIFKNCIVNVRVYLNSDYAWTGIDFIDYIKAHGGQTKEVLNKLLEESKNPLKEAPEKQEEEKLINMFLDWKNNFLTIGKFAEYYNLTIEKANFVIDKGRELNEQRAEDRKNPVIN